MKKGFTLVEVLAVIAVLGLVIAISIPKVVDTIRDSEMEAFRINAQMVLKSVELKIARGLDYDIATLNVADLKTVFGIDNTNFKTLTVTYDNEVPNLAIEGQNKWEGYIVYGTQDKMSVSESAYYDITPPVVSLIGSPLVYLEVGATYYEVGATATDDHDGDITNKISLQGNVVNVNVVGTYVLNYAVQDNAGNLSSVTRTVNVLANAIPTVAFGMNGNATYAKTRSTSVTVSDNVAVNPSSLEYQWTTSTTAPTEASFTTTFTNGATLSTPAGASGGYYLWILAKDTNGNTMIARSNVFNLDNAGPTITFGTNGNTTYAKTYSTTVTVADTNGVNTISLEYQWTTSTTAPTEASFTTTFTSGGTISTPAGVTGGYYLWILAKDNLTNTSITRSNVFNLDNTGPVITITGSNLVSVASGTTYTDAGATATDNVDGNRTANITVSSTVNTSATGTYTVTYNVKDSLGNVGTAQVRTVNVVVGTVEYLIVAGGGAGGYRHGAGGGGGGVLTGSTSVTAGTAYSITVGAGGLPVSGTAGGSGGNSVALGLTAIGGGGGASYDGAGGKTGGSGGGGAEGKVAGTGTTGQGYAGGTGSTGSVYNHGGGGGAGGVGQNGTAATCGDGGIGILSSISGTATYYGGGGGGGSHNPTPTDGQTSTGGLGGGGRGGTIGVDNAGVAGTANTGGGGGGASTSSGGVSNGGAGGSGIVIIRYYGAQKATGGTITSSGGYTIHTFTSSGTFTVTAS